VNNEKGTQEAAAVFMANTFGRLGGAMVGDADFVKRDYSDVITARHFETLFLRHFLELKLGKLADAKKGYDAILAEPRIKGFGLVHYGALHGRGLVALAEGDTASAIDYFKRAIDVIERQRSSITTEQHKIDFIGDKQSVYRDLVAALVKLERHAEAFEYAERAKSRALVDLLASKKSFGAAANTGKVANALAELDRLEKASLVQVAKVDERAGTRSIQQVKTDLAAQAPEVASLVSVSTASPADIQSRLAKDEALIEYFYQSDSDNLYAFLVTRSGIEAVGLDAKGLDDAVKAFRAAINDYPKGNWQSLSTKLHDRLIRPLNSALAGKRHLTVVPHGALHYLPFNALKAGNGRYLIEDHTVRLLPSASVMQFLNKGSQASESLLVFGNPDLKDASMDLPGAQAEARAIADLWSDSKVVLRQHASETVIKKTASAFKYLHLASHGQFDADKPLQSRMLLAADAVNDGNLTVPEIYDLNLNADMVVLSACQTALGDVKNGDDVVGLNRGFLYAGAKSIVGSLWEVPDDPTKDLMVSLYKNLKNMDLRKAMQQAQLETMKKYDHPIAWAAFQVTGGS
jgi:CHAT domain-containing protein